MEPLNDILFIALKQLRQEELTSEETTLLELWKQTPQNREFFNEITNSELLKERIRDFKQEVDNLDRSWERFIASGFPPTQVSEENSKVVRLRWLKWVSIAASIILVFGISYFLWVRPKPVDSKVVVTPVIPKTDATPKTKLAVLVLDNGSQIPLDSTKAGLMAKQGNATVRKEENGMISYLRGSDSVSSKVIYNTILVPKGSDVVYLSLSDGSKVWLNANSSIRYPVTFQDDRKVEITGEAYFEVAHSSSIDGNIKKPFTVSRDGVDVTVLGTHFNVNTYEDEGDIKVTLLEGSVKVSSDKKVRGGNRLDKVIKPGQQAVVNADLIDVVKDADIDQVMAWKNGKFIFKSTSIQLIMRQMERWYDLEPATYTSDEVKQWKFTGEVSRYGNASTVLELLQKSGGGNFKISGRKIIISK